MITLTTRREISEKKNIIASELTRMQHAFFDEEMLQFYKDDNEQHLYREMFDRYKKDEAEYSTFAKVIGLVHSDINTFTNKLAEKTTSLFQVINARDFYIISHLKLDFFGNRDNNFKPLKQAYKKLEKIVGNNIYKDAFGVDIDGLTDFIEILFWTTRCDPDVAEYVFIFDKDEQIRFYLCKYGNLHLTEYNEERLTEDKLKQLDWTIISGEECDNFETDGKIKGKQIKV